MFRYSVIRDLQLKIMMIIGFLVFLIPIIIIGGIMFIVNGDSIVGGIVTIIMAIVFIPILIFSMKIYKRKIDDLQSYDQDL